MLHRVSLEQLSGTRFMTSPTVTITEDLTINEAILITRRHNIHHAPVVDATEKVTAIITKTNIADTYYNSAAGF